MSNLADLLRSAAAVLWALLAITIVAVLYRFREQLLAKMPPLHKVGVGPVSFEFAESLLDRSLASRAGLQDQGLGEQACQRDEREIGEAAKRGVISRLQRNADLLRGSRLLWVDDHPELNVHLVQLLEKFEVAVDLATTNAQALGFLRGARYNVILSDVGRDNEPNGSLKGIQLAEEVFGNFGQRIALFTERFNPITLPSSSDSERLDMVAMMQRTVFGVARYDDELLHLVLDILERQ